MAVLSFVGPDKWRSRQFSATFSSPSANQVCWMTRFFESHMYSRVLAGVLNHFSSRVACSNQKAWESWTDRSYISWYLLKDPIWALAETADGGGEVWESFCKEVMNVSCLAIY